MANNILMCLKNKIFHVFEEQKLILLSLNQDSENAIQFKVDLLVDDVLLGPGFIKSKKTFRLEALAERNIVY